MILILSKWWLFFFLLPFFIFAENLLLFFLFNFGPEEIQKIFSSERNAIFFGYLRAMIAYANIFATSPSANGLCCSERTWEELFYCALSSFTIA